MIKRYQPVGKGVSCHANYKTWSKVQLSLEIFVATGLLFNKTFCYGPAHFNFLTNSVIDFSQWGAGKSMMRPFVDRWINCGGGRRASSLLIGRENRNLIPDLPKGINKLENSRGQGCMPIFETVLERDFLDFFPENDPKNWHIFKF